MSDNNLSIFFTPTFRMYVLDHPYKVFLPNKILKAYILCSGDINCEHRGYEGKLNIIFLVSMTLWSITWTPGEWGLAIMLLMNSCHISRFTPTRINLGRLSLFCKKAGVTIKKTHFI